MKPLRIFLMLICASYLSIGTVAAQIESEKEMSEDGTVIRLSKEIPTQENPEITGDGLPQYIYVVQLARFESLDTIPDRFPKGSILWVNPDHAGEKLLLGGFYNSFEDAQQAAESWKQQFEFQQAFAREKPFLIRYNPDPANN